MADVSGNVVWGGASICSPQSISNVKIIQTYYDQFYNESFSALIYDGSPDEINGSEMPYMHSPVIHLNHRI